MKPLYDAIANARANAESAGSSLNRPNYAAVGAQAGAQASGTSAPAKPQPPSALQVALNNQVGDAREVGQGIQNEGQSIFAGQQQAAGGFAQQGAGFNATAPSLTGVNPQTGLGSAGRSTGSPMMQASGGGLPTPGRPSGYNAAAALQSAGLGPAQSAQGLGGRTPAPAFATGERASTGGLGGFSTVDPGQLGGYGSAAAGLGAAPGGVAGQLGGAPGSIAGQLGAGPGAVAGQLGGGYQVGNVGGIAGQLGGAPQVGTVGNIQMGGAPGMVQGTFGNQGVTSGDQASMMGRINSFLDSPEGPSVAEAQLKQAQTQNMAQMLGMARSGRGGAGAQSQALAQAMGEGGAIASETAGQLGTLRAQEEDMRRNRALSAIGLGGELATASRGQDLSVRGQNLAAAQGDQSAQLGARGQDLTGAMANQSTQTQLEQLRAQTALGARGQDLSALQGDQSTALGLEGLRANTSVATRGQDLSALQGDQSTALGARGQNLGALMSDQQTALGARGQNLSALQGDQSTALGARGQDLGALSADLQAQIAARGQNLGALQGNQSAQIAARGQDVTQQGNVLGANTALRGQDLSALQGDQNAALAAQGLNLQAGLGYGQLQNQATGMGLNYLQGANQQALTGEALAQDALNTRQNNWFSYLNAQTAADAGIQQQHVANQGGLSFGQQAALAGIGAFGAMGGGGLSLIASDERVKTDIAPLDAIGDHLRGAPGYRYRYKEGNGVGEDPRVEHAGPMAQDLERGPFGKALVKHGPDGVRRVDTGRLSLVNHAALSSMRSELDRIKALLEEAA
jgi:hypothetical protein